MNAAEEAARKLATVPADLRLAVLFSSRAQRPALTALMAVYLEIREILHECSDPVVARTKLGWWREEINLLAARKPRHPVTMNLAQCLPESVSATAQLLETLDSVEIDIASPVFQNFEDVERYCRYRGGALLQLATILSGAQQTATLEIARNLGVAWQLANIVVQAGADIQHGCVYFATQDLRKYGLERHIVGGTHTETGLMALLSDYTRRAQEYAVGATSRAAAEYKTLIAARVLNGLAQMRLKIYAKHGYDMTQPPVELPPFTRLLTAWRSARLTHAA